LYKGLYFIIALQNNLQCIIIITETRLQRSDYFREMVILETWLQKNNLQRRDYRDAIIIKK